MGLFSLFRKDKPIVDDDEVYARLAADSALQRQDAASTPPVDLDLQRDIARATILKIDAIEAAMAADMFDEPAFRRPPRRAAAPAATDVSNGPVTELLDDDELPAEAAAAERAPVVEEAAILYANGQPDEACQLLAGAVGARPATDRTAWWMLFDLYGALHRQEAFDSLSIDYASTFETSPPPWNPVLPDTIHSYSGFAPTVALAGVLDENAAAQIDRIRVAADGAAVLRLDFSRVTSVEPGGCALLHDALRTVRQRELMLAGAEELLAQVRSIIDVGRRDEGEAPWLLMLELLRLLNREKAFEEASMDYCVTFEVSPPSFTPPGKVASTPRQVAGPATDRYLLPHVIEGDAGEVWSSIRAHAEHAFAQGTSLVFDCSRLVRIDYAAAGHLFALLQQLAGPGNRIDFRELNHLVAALFRLLGYADVARLFPHRY
ncbi:STAS domain-containing protein [Pseudoduganella lutea]|uniref:STAS domain-containing protein n=1 Tax=Pseudoduganella lutea TaxID=321985 RepID=A0A4P6KWK0_9BURK|nr:STAS domain-containing protein [Pseudoduganella lutea]QBE63509.1 STAS domain-containing protein [Pseudoduganella lutea]